MKYCILLCSKTGILLSETQFHLPVRKDKEARVYCLCSVDYKTEFWRSQFTNSPSVR